jgi:hypothetical protein
MVTDYILTSALQIIKKLRWKYGRYMEDQSATEREKKKGYSALLLTIPLSKVVLTR